MSRNFEQTVEGYQMHVAHGDPQEKVVEDLHTDGLTIIEAIKVVRVLYSMNLRDAHNLVAGHPAWAEVVRNAKPLHDAIEEFFEMLARGELP